MIAVSVVSHGHGEMVSRLLVQLRECPEVTQIIVTRNIPENTDFPGVTVIDNPIPRGFGENHNAAFGHCTQPYWCVLNPDIELAGNPFPALLELLVEDARLGLVAPVVTAPDGTVEDSIRHFPTVASIFCKVLKLSDGRHRIEPGIAAFNPDWVAGMFMLYSSAAYRRLSGFDERYFLYYEDVDICVRAWRMQIGIAVATSTFVMHDARRSSRRNLRFLKWHLASMLRFLWKFSGRLPRPFLSGN